MDMIRFKSLTWTEKLSMVTMFYPGTFFLGGGIRREAWVNYPCGLLTHTTQENTVKIPFYSDICRKRHILKHVE